jgi:hypothetical protein
VRVTLITGTQAAGKSTVAQALAERLPRSVPEVEAPEAARHLSIVGLMESERSDISEDHEAVIRDRLNRSS